MSDCDNEIKRKMFIKLFEKCCLQEEFANFCFETTQCFNIIKYPNPSIFCIDAIIYYCTPVEAQKRLRFLAQANFINLNCLASNNIRLLDLYAAQAVHEGNFNPLVALLNAGANPYFDFNAEDGKERPSSADLVQALAFTGDETTVKNVQTVLGLFKDQIKK